MNGLFELVLPFPGSNTRHVTRPRPLTSPFLFPSSLHPLYLALIAAPLQFYPPNGNTRPPPPFLFPLFFRSQTAAKSWLPPLLQLLDQNYLASMQEAFSGVWPGFGRVCDTSISQRVHLTNLIPDRDSGIICTGLLLGEAMFCPRKRPEAKWLGRV